MTAANQAAAETALAHHLAVLKAKAAQDPEAYGRAQLEDARASVALFSEGPIFDLRQMGLWA